MPRINLLPWREQQRTDRKKAFGVGMGVAAVAAILITGVGYLLFSQMIEAQKSRNTGLREEIKELDKRIEQINNLELQKQQFIARMQIIEKLQRSRPEIVHVFDTFTKIVPDGTYITAITQTDQKFKIQGVAQSPTRVSSFMRSIDESQWLKEADLDGDGIKGLGTGYEFTLYAKQKVMAEEAPPKASEKRKKR